MKYKVPKIEAARRQLAESIRLWFNDGDLSSMHMLACSAHQVVSDINAARGGTDLIYDSLVIKDQFRTQWINKVKESYNHLKHADRRPDPNHEIELDSELTEYFILFTCVGLEALKFPLYPVERAFALYFLVLHPEYAKDGVDPFAGFPEGWLEAARTTPKAMVLPALLNSLKKAHRG